MNPKKSNRPKKRGGNKSIFNTVLFIVLAAIVIYLLVIGFMWAWDMMAGWDTL